MKSSRAVDAIETSDVVVVGGGAAGMAAALGLEGLHVRLLAKGPAGADGASAMAQGGIAAAIGPDDCPQRHAGDTLDVAGGIAVESAIEQLTAGAADWIVTLESLGAGFDRDGNGDLALGREAAHSRPRIVHAEGDSTGRNISLALGGAVSDSEHVELEDGALACDLIRHGSQVVGVVADHPEHGSVAYLARAVVLATGGIGRVYRDTTNPSSSTGDGLAMAARAGAALADLEFVQFHPTALAVETDPRPLLTEALRGAGARLVDASGRRFLAAIDSRAELASRDIVARAIAELVAAGERVWLDATDVARGSFPSRFPTVFEICREHGLDPRRDLLEVRPAAHYHMGGVVTDLRGRTSLPGLWAAGEVACTGVHGANRLASNSLLECLVFGREAAEDIVRSRPAAPPPLVEVGPMAASTNGRREPELETRVRELMTRHLGVLRHAEGLGKAHAELAVMADDVYASHPTTRNLWTVAALVTSAAHHRRESRGSHNRPDFAAPSEDGSYRLALWMGERNPLEPVVERFRPGRSYFAAVGR